MQLQYLLSTDAILPNLPASTKKLALQDISDLAGRISGLPAREIFDCLLQRERLGSTGVGSGIAIPHGRMAKATQIFGVFARLEKPIQFDALDGAPVDLIFMLIAPESAGADHLKALSRVARVLRDSKMTERLRAARDAAAIYAMMTVTPASHAA